MDSVLSLPPLAYVLLAIAGFAGGLVDSIAGGGGLITVPALLAAGLPPWTAPGTNKLQSSCGTLLAVTRYARAGLLTTPGLAVAVVSALSAGAAGAFVVGKVDPQVLRPLIPVLLGVVVLYTALHRNFGAASGNPLVKPALFALFAGSILGFYDGFFGPGTGAFWTLGLVSLLRLELRDATGYTKAVNLASNLGALLVFAAHSSVHYSAAAAMIAGQLAGAGLGSGMVIQQGRSIIRPVFIAVTSLLTLKLLYDAWFS